MRCNYISLQAKNSAMMLVILLLLVANYFGFHTLAISDDDVVPDLSRDPHVFMADRYSSFCKILLWDIRIKILTTYNCKWCKSNNYISISCLFVYSITNNNIYFTVMQFYTVKINWILQNLDCTNLVSTDGTVNYRHP